MLVVHGVDLLLDVVGTIGIIVVADIAVVYRLVQLAESSFPVRFS